MSPWVSLFANFGLEPAQNRNGLRFGRGLAGSPLCARLLHGAAGAVRVDAGEGPLDAAQLERAAAGARAAAPAPGKQIIAHAF